MTGVRVAWEDPPSGRTGGAPRKWEWILEPLMSEPGRWARIAEKSRPEYAYKLSSALRHGLLCIPPGEWEFTTRQRVVYARYIGPSGGA